MRPWLSIPDRQWPTVAASVMYDCTARWRLQTEARVSTTQHMCLINCAFLSFSYGPTLQRFYHKENVNLTKRLAGAARFASKQVKGAKRQRQRMQVGSYFLFLFCRIPWWEQPRFFVYWPGDFMLDFKLRNFPRCRKFESPAAQEGKELQPHLLKIGQIQAGNSHTIKTQNNL